MGLDIYLYSVTKPNEVSKYDELFKLDPEETNKSTIELFKHFSDYTVQTEELVFSEKLLDNYLGSWNIPMDAELVDSHFYYNENDETTYILYTYDNDRTVTIPKKTYDSFYITVPTVGLYVDSVYTQRKGMKTEFYSEFMSGCWYITDSNNDPDDAPKYIFTNEMLKKAKKYVEDKKQPLYKHKLKDDQFIWFWY